VDFKNNTSIHLGIHYTHNFYFVKVSLSANFPLIIIDNPPMFAYNDVCIGSTEEI
jgi:hypothetical protein